MTVFSAAMILTRVGDPESVSEKACVGILERVFALAAYVFPRRLRTSPCSLSRDSTTPSVSFRLNDITSQDSLYKHSHLHSNRIEDTDSS